MKKESLLNRFKTALRGSTAVKTDAGGGGLLFGVPLEIIADMGPPLMSASALGVPLFLETAFDYLKTSESATEGVFRLSGSSATIKEYKRVLDGGAPIVWMAGRDAHNAAGLIKMYLRELPEPLLTFDLWGPFCHVIKVADPGQKLELFSLLLAALPVVNYTVVKYISGELRAFSRFEEHTKMGVSNLSTLFGPNIGRPELLIEDQGEMLIYTSQATAICMFLITNYDGLFVQRQPSTCCAVGTAPFDYEPVEGDEARLTCDDVVFVRTQDKDWWDCIVVDSEGGVSKGRVAANYVNVICTLGSGAAPVVIESDANEDITGDLDVFASCNDGLPSAGNCDDAPAEAGMEKADPNDGASGDLLAEELDGASGDLLADELDGLDFTTQANTSHPSASPSSHPSASPSSSSSASSPPSAISSSGSMPVVTPEEQPIKQQDLNWSGRIAALEAELVAVRLDLAEEQRQREQLAQIVPELMKNQDEILKLLLGRQ